MGKKIIYHLFILLIFLSSSQSSFAQSPLDEKVSIAINSAPISDILDQITDQTGVFFTYGNHLFSEPSLLSIKVKKTTIRNILKQLLEGTSIEFKAIGGSIVLYRSKSFYEQRDRYTLSGFIKDAETGERLIGANIYTPDLKGTTSNNAGYFSLTLPADTMTITLSYLGYHSEVILVNLKKDIQQNFQLKPSIDLATVLITDSDSIQSLPSIITNNTELKLHELLSVPAIGGLADPFKMIQLLPGVQSGQEGSAGLYIRGGGPDQNLILLDDVPVYYPNHLFGFYSIFNPSAIKSLQLIKGSYSAKYGGRLSSIIDVHTKDGDLNQFHGEANLGLIAADFALEGPLVKDKTSFMFSARRTYLDLLMQPITQKRKKENNIDGSTSYYFYDLNGKITHHFSDRDQLSFHFFSSKDRYNDNGEFAYVQDTSRVINSNLRTVAWKNLISAVRWNHVFSKKLFARTQISFTNYKLNFDELNGESQVGLLDSEALSERSASLNYTSEVKDWLAKVHFDYLPAPNHFVKIGMLATRHSFIPGKDSLKEAYQVFPESQVSFDTVFNNYTIPAWEADFYIEDDFKISDFLKLNLGLHGSAFWVDQKFYWSVQPRILANVIIRKRWALKASFSTMTQYLHLLTNSGLGLPTDLWLPPVGLIEPQEGWQSVVGLNYSPNHFWDISIEGYYKRMNNLISFKRESRFLLNSDRIDEKVTFGSGKSYGGEFLIHKKSDPLRGWIGYTLSLSERTFPEINNGVTFPYKYDRRHDVSLALFYKLNPKIEFSGIWVYGTGNAITLPISEFPLVEPNSSNPPVILYNYGDRNSFRMPAYHRLDLGAKFVVTKKWGVHSIYLGIYNVYNRKNPYFISLNVNPNEPDTKEFSLTSLIPILPSVRYGIKF